MISLKFLRTIVAFSIFIDVLLFLYHLVSFVSINRIDEVFVYYPLLS